MDPQHPGVWRGLLLNIWEAPRAGMAMTACQPKCTRLALGATPLLWSRIESDYFGYHLLRARRHSSLNTIPPIPFETVRSYGELAGNSAFDRAWAVAYSEWLATSDASPLVNGMWHLGRFGPGFRLRELSTDLVQRIVGQKTQGYVEWDFGDEVYPITLRDLSPPDSGRVKAWRKRARDGTLPPVLLYWVSGLQAHVVLDGHDRLLAAAIEGRPAASLSLERVEEHQTDQATRNAVLRQVEIALTAAEVEPSRATSERLARARHQFTVGDANRLLLDVFLPQLHTRATQAMPLEGGLSRWVSEVRHELEVQAGNADGLLCGLPGEEGA